MKIFVKAKPGAREERVVQMDATHFEVAVREPPIKGAANAAICRVLAAHFGVSVSAVRIISGYTSRSKIVSVAE